MKRLLLAIIATHAASACIGDTLQFKSGKIYQCQILTYEEGYFTVVMDGKKQQAPAKTIYRIEFAPLATNPFEGLSSPPVPPPDSTPNGRWKLSTEMSPIDDSQTIILRLYADGMVTAGYKKSQPQLYIRYKEARLEAYIAFDFFIGSDGTEVTTRMGDESSRTRQWSTSSDYEAVFFPGDVETFINDLSRVDKFVVRLTPYGESPVTATFTTTGLSEAAKPLLLAVKASRK